LVLVGRGEGGTINNLRINKILKVATNSKPIDVAANKQK